MGDRSNIEWTDATWNPVRARNNRTGEVGWHCEHVSDGCRNCYAESINLRLGTGLPFKPSHFDNGDVDIFLDEKMLLQPLHWKKPRRIFVHSMTDSGARFVTRDMFTAMLDVIELAKQHTFLLLSKRPERVRELIIDEVKRADWQPLLEPVLLWSIGVKERAAALLMPDEVPGLDWVIVGGESGGKARAFDARWAIDIVKQCKAARVACFVKQMGAYVVDRNDAGFEGCDKREWNIDDEGRVEHDIHGYREEYQGADCRIRLRDRKGGDPAEWPEMLRVREFPA